MAVARACVTYNYVAQDSSQMSLVRGQTLQVYDMDDSGWWSGYNEYSGEEGLFPSTYVELFDEVAQTPDESQYYQQVPMNQYYPSKPSGTVAMGAEMDTYNKKAGKEQKQALIGDKGKGKEDKPVVNTRYGFYATNMIRLNGFATFWVGVCSLIMWVESIAMNMTGLVSTLQITIFIYAILLGGVSFMVETLVNYRGPGSVSIRTIVYILASGPLFATFFTLFNGVLYLIAAYFFYLGTRYQEVIPAPKVEGKKEGGKKGACCNPLCFVCEYYSNKQKEQKCGKELFMYGWILLNVGLFALGLIQFYPQVMPPNGTLQQFTVLLPYAKGFGFGLDLTCAVIVLPVSRTFIRQLYDYSTQDQSRGSRILRSILWLFPLDKALHFHEKTGWLILFLSFGHSFAHLINAGLRFQPVVAFYGWSPLITGFLLWVVIFFMFPAVLKNVKGGHFEIFWYSHQLFWLFFALNLIHGRGTLGPNYWKAFIVPGTIYILERIYREYSAYQTVSVVSITNMKGNVLSVEFSKSAFPNGYLEGQYCYINCPSVSRGQWHPFTISSAPGDPTVTLHIKIQGKNSWTRQLLQYFSFMGLEGQSYFQLSDIGPNGIEVGKTRGPSGERMLLVYGPHSAPTQHAPEYPVDIIVGSGIGVTPVSATMQQIVFYRWKYNIGDSNPDHAYFYWVCNYNEIETFRWMIRTVKECHDEVYDLRLKNPDTMGIKTFQVHIFVTSIPDDAKVPDKIVVDDDVGFWGRPRKPTGGVAKAPEQYSELDIYRTMLSPPKGSPAELGDIRIYNGRPNWKKLFGQVAESHIACKIGVEFCGNPRIGDDLKDNCRDFTSPEKKQFFILHKENF